MMKAMSSVGYVMTMGVMIGRFRKIGARIVLLYKAVARWWKGRRVLGGGESWVI